MFSVMQSQMVIGEGNFLKKHRIVSLGSCDLISFPELLPS